MYPNDRGNLPPFSGVHGPPSSGFPGFPDRTNRGLPGQPGIFPGENAGAYPVLPHGLGIAPGLTNRGLLPPPWSANWPHSGFAPAPRFHFRPPPLNFDGPPRSHYS